MKKCLHFFVRDRAEVNTFTWPDIIMIRRVVKVEEGQSYFSFVCLAQKWVNCGEKENLVVVDPDVRSGDETHFQCPCDPSDRK